MMFLKRTAAAILGGAILCSGAAFAANVNTVSAEQPVADTAVSTDATAQETPAVLAERNLYYGKITEITRDEQTGAVTSLLMESEKYGAYVFPPRREHPAARQRCRHPHDCGQAGSR